MAFFLTQAEWDQYISDIFSFCEEDAFKQEIIWKKSIGALNSDGSDDGPMYSDKTLLGLIQYNDFRSWPINTDSITGEIDKESMMLLLSNKFLAENGYLNTQGIFKFDPSLDKFLVNGVLYKAKGDSQTAQANNTTLLHFIILKRDTVDTSSSRY